MENIAVTLGLVTEDRDMRQYVEDYEKEMLRGLEGEASSLLMLPTYISQESLGFGSGQETPEGGARGQVAVIDAGGTNLRVAQVEFTERGPRINYFEKYPIPGFGKPVSVETFFNKLAEYLKPIITKCDRIGFCFSNPAEIMPNKDAKIVKFTKEVVVTGSQGVVLGEALQDALKGIGLPGDKNVVVLNDTVATQLGAMADARERGGYSGYIGLILGTGINASYSESNKNITKNALLRDKPGTTIINTETGGYGGFPQNEVDRRFAAATVDPEHCKFEKMASGAYQYDLLLEWVRFAADAGAFSRAFVGKLAALGRIPIGDADRFYFEPGEDSLSALCAAEKDEMRLRQLIDAFFDRVAFLTVATLIGLLKRTVGEGETPGLPVCISAEGTTFYNAKLLRPKIDQYMKRHSEGEFGLRHVFMRVEDATIFGSAVASFAK